MKQKPNQITFGLQQIKTEQFATFEEVLCDGGKTGLTTNVKFGADLSHRIVGVIMSFTFNCNNSPFIKLETSCGFQIIEDDWKALKDEEKLTIPKGLAQHLAVIAVGTSRGILHAKTEGTDLNKFFLPTINVTELVKEDQVFEFEDEKSTKE
jgi:hypothetical protein